MDCEEFRRRGKEMIDYICDYLQTIDKRRVISDVEPGYLRPLLPNAAPESPESWDAIMHDVTEKIMPGITHWQHPHFHAYFPSGNSFPSILGDMLGDAIGSIGFSWAASPACTELETIVMDWYGKALDLPPDFISTEGTQEGGGVIQASASECILVAMLSARNRAINYLFEKEGKDEDQVHPSKYLPNLIAYCSTETHSSTEKAAKILLCKLHILEVDEKGSLRGDTLLTQIEKDVIDGLFPFFVVATLGSTGICTFDNLEEIGRVCKQNEALWMHIDAAYFGNAFICPELRYLKEGIEYADSFNTNTNKWLLVNFDCSCLWVRNRNALISALVVDPLYLKHQNENQVIDYRHWAIPLSRRFRSLKLWFVMRSYGLEGLRSYIRKHIELAKEFEDLMRNDARFEIVNEVKAGLVAFRVKSSDDVNRHMLDNLNNDGKIHMVPAMSKGQFIIRFCVINEHATKEHIHYAWKVISDEVNSILPKRKTEKPPLLRQNSSQRAFTVDVARNYFQRQVSGLHDFASPLMIPNANLDEDDEEVDRDITAQLSKKV